MRVPVLLVSLVLPLLSVAQSKQVNTSQTITSAPSTASNSASASASGSSISGSANVTGSAAGNATTTATTTSILPTAPSTVDGASGDGPNGQAPSPGATASGGIYGPPDGYIASAEALRSAGFLGFLGLALGGALILV